MTGGKTQTTISIVTPCYNAEKYIAETVRSVINNSVFQNPEVHLEYFICDGGSTDRTEATVRNISAQIAQENIRLEFLSEPDGGMYEALAKGLARVSGDVCAYINAGDFYSPNAFEIVLEIFNRPLVTWLTGMRVQYNERSHLVYAELPFKYRKGLCTSGFYGKVFPFIQQESTFWRGALTRKLDLNRLAQYRYAGDYYLWNTFARTERLYIVAAWLGGFKSHENQLSQDMQRYLAEMSQIAGRPRLVDHCVAFADRLVWNASDRMKKILNRDSMFTFDFKSQRYLLRLDRRVETAAKMDA